MLVISMTRQEQGQAVHRTALERKRKSEMQDRHEKIRQQTDKHQNGQIAKQKNSKTDKQLKTDKQQNRQTAKQTDSKTGKQQNRQPAKQTNSKTDNQQNRQTAN